MTIRFRKKLRKQRGTQTHGYGSKKKHRGGGSQGGRGFSGMHKHKFSLTTSYAKDHYGYTGFFSLRKKDKTINIDEIIKLAENNNEIDLTKLGYSKLLSRGKITRAITIKVKKYSQKAKEKIEKAGGKIIAS